MNRKHIQHLYWRAGFGISPNELQELSSKTRTEIVNDLFEESNELTALEIDTSEFLKINPKKLKEDKEAFRKFKELSKEKLIEYNVAWTKRLSNPKELLREKMVLFWSNHFVCRSDNVMLAEQYNNTLRYHALGHFGNFTKAISKESAMINYLNLRQNTKLKPNENFARELMELFTLGKGNYSEMDIKESARAFTGYGHDFFGTYRFKMGSHDYKTKTFFKRKGAFNGNDIIDIILLEKQCAKFICEKIYHYFVNNKVNNNHINEMVSVFYPKYDIENLMRFVFMSDWFYNEEHIGSKIKSPIEFLIGMYKTVPFEFKKAKQLLAVQKLLGQVLLNPPNVAGWKGGKNWIDSNTILLRLRLPSILLNDARISLKEKGDFSDSLSQFIRRNAKFKLFDVDKDWGLFEKEYDSLSYDEMKKYILIVSPTPSTKALLNDLGKVSKQEHCIQLMSLPEYQMC